MRGRSETCKVVRQFVALSNDDFVEQNSFQVRFAIILRVVI
jgi:hypothetical protein